MRYRGLFMEWIKISLSRDDVAEGKLGEIQDAFAALFMSAGGPVDAAMFSRSRLVGMLIADPRFDPAEAADTDVDEEPTRADYQTLYFSPAAVQLARNLISHHGGRPCNQPGRCALLVGHQD